MTTLRDVLSSLGITAQEKQAALLQNMFFEGLFNPKEVWDSLHRLEAGVWKTSGDVVGKFTHITMALKRAHAYRENKAEFNANILLDAELGHGFSLPELQDWITYSRQSSYGRKVGEEREDLKGNAHIQAVTDQYMKNAQILGMTDTVTPSANAEYDESWVQCASRLRIETRLDFLLEQKEAGTEIGKIRMITGERPARAPFDGKELKENGELVLSREAEGLAYLQELAEAQKPSVLILDENGNPSYVPVINDNGKVIGQTVATTRTLWEYDIAADLAQRAKEKHPEIDIASIGQTLEKGDNKQRPDTKTTSNDAAQQLIERIQAGHFAHKDTGADGKIPIHILNVTDQPFIERMHIQVQNIIDDKLAKYPELARKYNITVETIGKGCGKEALNVITSDGAPLAAQQYNQMTKGESPRRDVTLLFSNNETIRTLPVPEIPARLQENLTRQGRQLG